MPFHRSLIAALVLTVSGTVVAQSTWTSFLDRKNHAIASAPNGTTLMFGGESVSTNDKLGDTKSLLVSGAGASLAASWSSAEQGSPPSSRSGHAMAGMLAGPAGQDALFLAFGGADQAGPSNDTFTYDGGGWGKVLTTLAPSAREGHAIVADLQREVFVLFGGFAGGVPQNDLWEFDPSAGEWDLIQPPTLPSARGYHSMSYNPLNGLIYLFGGSPFLSDMWVYAPDPVAPTWTQLSPTVNPGGRQKAAMAYITTSNRIVLFGGQDNGLAALADTWTFDPSLGQWSNLNPAVSPSSRFSHAMAAAGPDTVAMLGGTNVADDAFSSTWLWDGVNWQETLRPPSIRTGISMAYSSTNGSHLMFGGKELFGGAVVKETWQLEGFNWRRHTPLVPLFEPSARDRAGLAHDRVRNRTVLYGGRSDSGMDLGDTWEWDGNQWAALSPMPTPPAASGIQLAFDSSPDRPRTWMLHGADMWSFDGASVAWQRSELPAIQNLASGSFDSGRGRLVVFDVTVAGGTWEWDATTSWQAQAPSHQPSGRYLSAMAYDEARGETVLFGGVSFPIGAEADTWVWDGTDWTEKLVVGPPARANHQMAYDNNRGLTVLFGGSGGSTAYSDIWEWDGTNWLQVTTSNPPSPRGGASFAYDQAADRFVLFGGQGLTTGAHGDTWLYNPATATWTEQTALATAPSARIFAPITYQSDQGPLGQGVVMHGGNDFVTILTDTWRWDGAAWHDLSAPSGPSRVNAVTFFDGSNVTIWAGNSTGGLQNDMWAWQPGAGQPGIGSWLQTDSGSPRERTLYGATYDSGRDRVVVFGGSFMNGDRTNETWEWDGNSWLQRFPAMQPSARHLSQLTYDEARQRVVLFGGSDGINTFSDTWEWDGVNWIQRAPTTSPIPSLGHAMSYDPARRLVTAFGWIGTWDYGPENPGTIESTPTAAQCVGSNGAPTITPTIWAGPWLGAPIGVIIDNAPIIAVGVMIFGLDNQFYSGLPLPIPLAALGNPLCQLNIAADILEVMSFPLPNPYIGPALPSNPMLLGETVYAQAGFIDFGQPGNPFITSNSLTLTIGAK